MNEQTKGDQRLTASKVSTPQKLGQVDLAFVVINALRHQRLVHLGGQDLREWVEKEVINALRHQRLVHDRRSRTTFYRHGVINALRHQRLVHESGYRETVPR